MKSFSAVKLILLPIIYLLHEGLGAPVRGATGSVAQGQGGEKTHLKAAAAVTAASNAASKARVSLFPAAFPPGVKFAAPGANWLTDPSETLLFLPISVSKELPLKNLKMLCDGQSILVLSTVQPDIEVNKAERKFKLLLEALKSEAKGDEKKLENELNEWYKSEQDDEVKALVGETLYGLREVMYHKANDNKRVSTVPLGALVQRAAAVLSSSTLHKFLQATHSTGNSTAKGKQGMSALSLRSQRDDAARIIKESFMVEMPVPHDPLHVFALQKTPEEYFVAYVFNPANWGKGDHIAHEQLPFKKLNIFDMKGKPVAVA